MRVLRYHDFADMGIHYSREHINRLIKLGQFPASFRLSEHRIVWLESAVHEWLTARANGTAKPRPQPARRRKQAPIAPEPLPRRRPRVVGL